MQVGYGMHMEQTQKLIMTPELRQAIWVLQLSSNELIAEIQHQLEENPTLEIVEDNGEVRDENPELTEGGEEFEWQKYTGDNHEFDEERGFREVKEQSALQNWVATEQTLSDYLFWQLHLSTSDQEIIKIGHYLIGHINDNGYLKTSVEDVAHELNVERDKVNEALQLIQSFDPSGVGARNLQECLIIQLDNLGNRDPLIRKIINNYLTEIADGKMVKVAQELEIPLSELQKMLDFIVTLDPKPGRRFSSSSDVRYLVPDVYVEKVGDDFVVVLNDMVTPTLNISPYYQNILRQRQLEGETLKFIENKINSALWFIRSIEQRRMTIYKVTESIVRFQRKFFELGIRHLIPLTLKQVAADINMHESTVSRATTNKYVQTPHGLFELSFFFSSGLENLGGGGVSSASVKKMIEDLVKEEDPKKPLSDQKIADILGEKGIEISRRTVAKYREEIGIPSSAKRKRYS